jgi:DNA-binding GntR family transcriptional regulator
MVGIRGEGTERTRAAVEALRAALADGDLAPGQRLIEADLAASFGMSRAGVRAALIQLAGEGLVERVPNRGARVRVYSVAEAVALTECRLVLEGLCAAKAAERATDDQLAVLTDLGDQLRRAVTDADPMKYSALNRELHRLIREYAAQPVATELLDRLNGQLVRHQFRLALRPGRPQVSLPEHLAIIDAICRRDPPAAETAARTHISSVIQALQDTAD